jgi:hypothetical protein
LWDEERVDALMQRDWRQVDMEMELMADEIEDAIQVLYQLDSPSARIYFIESLGPKVVDCLLVEFAKELKELQDTTGETFH